MELRCAAAQKEHGSVAALGVEGVFDGGGAYDYVPRGYLVPAGIFSVPERAYALGRRRRLGRGDAPQVVEAAAYLADAFGIAAHDNAPSAVPAGLELEYERAVLAAPHHGLLGYFHAPGRRAGAYVVLAEAIARVRAARAHAPVQQHGTCVLIAEEIIAPGGVEPGVVVIKRLVPGAALETEAAEKLVRLGVGVLERAALRGVDVGWRQREPGQKPLRPVGEAYLPPGEAYAVRTVKFARAVGRGGAERQRDKGRREAEQRQKQRRRAHFDAPGARREAEASQREAADYAQGVVEEVVHVRDAGAHEILQRLGGEREREAERDDEPAPPALPEGQGGEEAEGQEYQDVHEYVYHVQRAEAPHSLSVAEKELEVERAHVPRRTGAEHEQPHEREQVGCGEKEPERPPRRQGLSAPPGGEDSRGADREGKDERPRQHRQSRAQI